MIKLINVLKVIVEGIHIKDDKYVVDYDKDYSEDLIKFSDHINFTKNKFPLFQQGNFKKAVDFFTEQCHKMM